MSTMDQAQRDYDNLYWLNQWIDQHPVNAARDREAALWGRVSKVGEEFGETIQALIGATNQNPRKGLTHTMDDVTKELYDVALTALCAVVHINPTADPVEGLSAHIERVTTRAHGRRSPSDCTECGRDNRNGTHDALELTGHLNHTFQQA
jgi:hypothetical protein